MIGLLTFPWQQVVVRFLNFQQKIQNRKDAYQSFPFQTTASTNYNLHINYAISYFGEREKFLSEIRRFVSLSFLLGANLMLIGVSCVQ